MSRQIEDYLCASEDRTHYNWDGPCLRGFHTHGMVAPHVINYNIINKTEVVEVVPEEKIKEMVDALVPNIQENITNDILTEINETIIPELTTEEIDEIYGGSATDVIKESETP